MIEEILVPLAYFLFLLLITGNKRFFKSKSISKPILLIAFSLKVICSLLFGYLFKSGMLTGEDTNLYFYNGNVAFSAFKLNPVTYFKLTLGPNDFTPVPKDLLQYTDNMHYWFDKSNYFIVRLNALIRPISFGIYNVHAIIFAFLSFVGIYNIYLFFENKMENKKILQLILFGIPSVVFWTSGIHKEALTIFGLGLILYNTDRIFMKQYSVGTFLFLLTGLVFLGYVRFYLLVILLPLILAMTIDQSKIFRVSSIFIYLLTIGMFCFITVSVDIISPKINLLHEFFERRIYFLHSLPGNMTFAVITKIPDTLSGYLTLIWEAVTNPLLRPFPAECKEFLPFLSCIEAYFFLLIMIYLLWKSNIKSLLNNSFSIFSILFGLINLFIIGLIVNNSGAIVRYRSIAIPFILIGLCLNLKDSKPVSINSK